MHATGLVSHERYFWHDPGSGAGFSTSSDYVEPDPHPESPSTKRRMLSLLAVSGLTDRLVPIAPRLATIEELRAFHTDRYIEQVRALSAGGGGSIGDSASIGHGSFEIARLAAGAIAIGLLRIGERIEIAPVGRQIGPAFEDELLVEAGRAGEVDAEHLLQLALVGGRGRPEIVDRIAGRLPPVEHDAQAERPVTWAVV